MTEKNNTNALKAFKIIVMGVLTVVVLVVLITGMFTQIKRCQGLKLQPTEGWYHQG